jgi:hypothetical protein
MRGVSMRPSGVQILEWCGGFRVQRLRPTTERFETALRHTGTNARGFLGGFVNSQPLVARSSAKASA